MKDANSIALQRPTNDRVALIQARKAQAGFSARGTLESKGLGDLQACRGFCVMKLRHPHRGCVADDVAVTSVLTLCF